MTSLDRLKTVLKLYRKFLNPPTTQFNRLSSKCEVSHLSITFGSSDIRCTVFQVKASIPCIYPSMYASFPTIVYNSVWQAFCKTCENGLSNEQGASPPVQRSWRSSPSSRGLRPREEEEEEVVCPGRACQRYNTRAIPEQSRLCVITTDEVTSSEADVSTAILVLYIDHTHTCA